jgi:hypothetical protein
MAALYLGNEGYSSDGVNGSVGIGTGSPAGKLEVAGTTVVNGGGANLDGVGLSFMVNSGKMLLGWNYSAGGGEADFITNRGAGNVGGFRFYDVNNSGTATQLMKIRGDGKVGINCDDPTGKLDVNDSKIRVRNSMTPSGTGDPSGNTGDICWDASYFYVKTGNGWKRAALGTF